MYSNMANLNLGQDVANKKKKIYSCSYSGQISIASWTSVSLRFSYKHQPLWLRAYDGEKLLYEYAKEIGTKNGISGSTGKKTPLAIPVKAKEQETKHCSHKIMGHSTDFYICHL